MSKETLLFFSAGASIDKTYSITTEEIKPTHVVILVEESIFHDSDNDSEFLKQEKPKIRKAIENVRKMVELDGRKEFLLERLEEMDQDIIRAKVMKIRNQHKDADFAFNVTSGTALFSVSLMLMGIWLNGTICITRENKPLIKLRVPKMSLTEIENEPELMAIINVLGSYNAASRETWIPNKWLARDLKLIENISERIGKNDSVKLSRWMKKLITEWNLVEGKGEGRTVSYRLTDDGLFAYNIFKGD